MESGDFEGGEGRYGEDASRSDISIQRIASA